MLWNLPLVDRTYNDIMTPSRHPCLNAAYIDIGYLGSDKPRKKTVPESRVFDGSNTNEWSKNSQRM